MIYLDNAATTRVFSEVNELMSKINREDFFNPSALYLQAKYIEKKIFSAREIIANKLYVKTDEIYFTSSATEANNWAIFCGYRNRKGNIITSQGEHSSIYEPCTVLKNKGVEVRFAPLNSDGTVNETELFRLVDENTLLVSLIHRSNETGTINDIFRLCKKIKSINKKIVFHSDGVQAFGKIDYNIGMSDIDLYSISGHKINGPKGIGALYINKKNSIRPYIFGGGQEQNMRSGTENVAGIVGFGEAAKLYYQKNNCDKNQVINDIIVKKLSDLEDIKINTSDCSSNIVSVSLNEINAEVLQRMLAADGIVIGIGSACASKLKSNRVLSAMGIRTEYIKGSIRISFGVDNTIDEVNYAMTKLLEKVNAIRGKKIG